jgi:hypothetical protein
MNYQEWTEEGKKNLVKQALLQVAEKGMQPPHHFYITFRTQFPGVGLPEFLYQQYPEEMTIVLNDAFWSLVVKEDHFSVDLLFEHKKSTLRIPYAALVHFIDPGVEFALQFNWENAQAPIMGDNVLILDHFRTKPVP